MAASANFGRYVCQLKRLTFNYCSLGGSSKMMRTFVKERVEIISKSYPNIAVYVTERPNRHPRIVANFLNDSSMVIPLKNDSVEQIDAWVHRLRSSSGKKRQDKYRWQTLNPSTQGTWSPYVNKNAVN
ncbi:39S ribosomal protein L43, mitochondrial-like [Xenia sp. Carnegie-2017]|uniref:39S ribosomal protein L43, mitochondrial-like n=1 Tax=Xenia sp. Carnegie-2017 TaxID=2897299 RepID=UPI001F033D8E|nr:39S ribosomal protein L43, mitochondrial-like [Xenia sp. Carnegie-2017]